MPAADWRAPALDALATRHFDVLVVGGGIVGGGVARDAALRGFSVALCEKDDFASGTSSRSSRLVHGGVRYLEHGHLHLVFESSRERRRLLRIAPHLVRPLAFTWPVYRGARVAHWKLLAGLTLYDALALFRNVGNHRRLSRDAVLAREPALRADDLQGGAIYWDASTDDSRLTLAAVLGARRAGAVVLNHARMVSLENDGRRATGAVVRDAPTGREVIVRARVVVSAVGPWTDELLAAHASGTANGASVLGSAGVHIAVPRHRVGNRDAVTLVAPQDGRVMFVLPARDQTIIGTTESRGGGGPDEIRATHAEVRYLLDACNASFPDSMLQDGDVVAAWSGIRPLAAPLADGDAGSASREHTVATTPLGVLVVTGGKLTTWRAMAEDVVDEVARALGAGDRSGRPYRETLLPGGELRSIAEAEQEAGGAIGDAVVGTRLAGAYGSAWRDVWRAVRDIPSLAERIEPALPYTFAEIPYAMSHEMAVTLGDFLIRRTHLAFEMRDHGAAAARRITDRFATTFGWDGARVTRELDAYEREVARIFSIA